MTPASPRPVPLAASAVRRPRLLTIAGSDSGGGAGIQADLKTFAAHGVYGMSALTAITAQNTLGVRAVFPLPPELVAAQIDAVWEDLGVDAVKIGMLAEAAIVRAVAARLVHHLGRDPGRPGRTRVVLDPVLAAKGGAPLLADDAVEAVLMDLLPLATLVTPNVPELERLTGLPAETEEERLAAARALSRSVAGGVAVLAKGGHAPGEEVVDVLVIPDAESGEGEEVHRFAAPRLPGRSTHGTGCTLSSAIAARLALPGVGREDLPAAVAGAIEYLRGAIAAAQPLGQGTGPVDHLWLF